MTDARDALPHWAVGLDLQPHPEGGWYRQTYRHATVVPPRLLAGGYGSERALATAILYLLLPGEISSWHVVRSDELWFHHRGGSLGVSIGGTGEAPSGAYELALGPAVERGERPQLLVPGGSWQSARPLDDEPVLVSCVVSPGFDFADFRLA